MGFFGRWQPAPYLKGTTKCGCSCHPAASDTYTKPLATHHELLFEQDGRQLPVDRCDECHEIRERAYTQSFVDYLQEGS